ncbi:KIF13B [Symbiodinium natans]|uniref:KIF13B protein n=1 Tax=Symbiodinium natans TaxID=878477 RepID=A0A812RAP0_9DINO|nr:KIF13B [Symbiodinium natans]
MGESTSSIGPTTITTTTDDSQTTGAKLKHKGTELFERVAQAAVEGIEKFDAQALSNTLWCLATLEIWGRPLKGRSRSKHGGAVRADHPGGDEPVVIVGKAWLWAHDEQFLRALAAQAMSHITELNKPLAELSLSQEISNMAWTLCPQMLEGAAAAQAVERMSELGELEISNTAWAFARISARDERLTEAASAAAMARSASALGGGGTVDNIEGLNPNGIYSIVWSSWRSGRARLTAALARQQERPEIDPESLVRGLLLMESAWQHDQLRESGVMSMLLGFPGGALHSASL